MLAKIKEDERILFEQMIHPIACGEMLFHDFDSMGLWSTELFGKIRPYQYVMLSYDSLFCYDKTKSSEENQIIENALAESYALGGRLTGKSIIFIILDTLLATLKRTYKWCVISSYDKLHVMSIFEKIINCVENHKVFKLLHAKPLRSPTYKINFNNGLLLESVNMNITGKNPGGQFYGKHVDRHVMEESSMLTKDVSSKMMMSQAESGCKNRYSGMTTFTKSSPMGEIFFDLKNKNKLINLPSYVNPTWNDKKEADAIQEFGGKDSLGYQVQIDGKVIEGMDSVFDILRIRETYLTDKQGDGVGIKSFEINKDTFYRYKEILVVERPLNAESLGIYFDVGEGGAPSEYIIVVKTNKLYRYIYRITTFQLSPNEEEEFVDYLIEILKPNIISLDHTSIDKDEYTLVKINKKLYYKKVKDIEKLINEKTIIEVPTYENKQLTWQRAKLIKHVFNGDMYKITTKEGNKSVKVTNNHSLMVYTRSGLISKKANECKIGDWVLSPRQIETTNCSPIFLKYKQKLINKFTKQSFSSIKLTSEFAYFLGWCVAEGCSKTTNYQLTTGWKFNDAKKILYLYRKLFKSLSGYILKSTPKQANKHCMYIRGRKIVAKKNNYRVVLGGGTGLNELFLNLCGNGSHNKKVPECIFQSNSIIQKSFLNGYIAGDGCIRKRNKKQIISFGTVSQELAYGLQCLYQINGVSCGLYFNKKTKSFNGEISVLTKNYGKQYGVPADLLGIKSWKKKKINDIKNWKNKINLFNMHKQKDWNYNQIKKLKKYYYRGIVYDFVVPKNHTFVAGNGNILVHNSGIGKSLYSHLINKYKDNAQSFIPVDFNSVIEIGFKKDTNGKFITDKNGKHVLETVSTVDWSVQQLKDIFYNKKIECYEDTKFDAQINNIISQRSKQGKILYDCKGENHLFQAFQVFAISHWITEFKQLQPIKRNKPGLGSFGSKQ